MQYSSFRFSCPPTRLEGRGGGGGILPFFVDNLYLTRKLQWPIRHQLRDGLATALTPDVAPNKRREESLVRPESRRAVLANLHADGTEWRRESGSVV